MNYNHLSINERRIIKQSLDHSYGIRYIAKILNRSPSTISRELKKYTNSLGEYRPHMAQIHYEHHKRNSRSYVMYDEKTINRVIELLKDYSPQQMYHYLRDEKLPSTSTIYKYLSLGVIHKKHKRLLQFRGVKFKRRTSGKYLIGKTISRRPKHIYNRKEFGHWEMDTVYSGKNAKANHCLLVIAERQTRYYRAIKIPDRTDKSVNEA